MGELSPDCFYDHCCECHLGRCTCTCHQYEEFNLVTCEWEEVADDEWDADG